MPEEAPIRELPGMRASTKCWFCNKEHDPLEKCNAMKQAIRLKGDWDQAEAKARKEAKAAADAKKVSFPEEPSTSAALKK